mmetsp:Transcript_1422/g.2680  ORF Transcript_1422/g.2680 Transcript_1422/m.2680 type:complete len:264 (+) Transcript_1422:784-1575(+)
MTGREKGGEEGVQGARARCFICLPPTCLLIRQERCVCVCHGCRCARYVSRYVSTSLLNEVCAGAHWSLSRALKASMCTPIARQSSNAFVGGTNSTVAVCPVRAAAAATTASSTSLMESLEGSQMLYASPRAPRSAAATYAAATSSTWMRDQRCWPVPGYLIEPASALANHAAVRLPDLPYMQPGRMTIPLALRRERIASSCRARQATRGGAFQGEDSVMSSSLKRSPYTHAPLVYSTVNGPSPELTALTITSRMLLSCWAMLE